MTNLAPDTYQDLGEVLKILEFSGQEIKQEIDRFEEELFADFTEAVLKKLPEQERKGVAELVNNATSEDKKGQLREKLAYWLNEVEVGRLWDKIAAELFKEFMQNAYIEAADEQKEKLKKMFKPEVLRGE